MASVNFVSVASEVRAPSSATPVLPARSLAALSLPLAGPRGQVGADLRKGRPKPLRLAPDAPFRCHAAVVGNGSEGWTASEQCGCHPTKHQELRELAKYLNAACDPDPKSPSIAPV